MVGKTALITGASRGIGAATARRLAQAGCAVAVNYCNSGERARRLVEELTAEGHRAMAVQADVSIPEQAFAMVDNVLEKFCQLDILVCNAGRGWMGTLGEMAEDEWRGVFGVNVDGVFHCCKAVLPHFVHKKAGKIINVASMWGQVGASCEVAYSASKAAVIGFTKALAKELGPSGITVNCVAPGVIHTEMNGHLTPEDLENLRLETPLERIGTPEDVAESILFLASRGGDFLTGQVICPNGGLVI